MGKHEATSVQSTDEPYERIIVWAEECLVSSKDLRKVRVKFEPLPYTLSYEDEPKLKVRRKKRRPQQPKVTR